MRLTIRPSTTRLAARFQPSVGITYHSERPIFNNDAVMQDDRQVHRWAVMTVAIGIMATPHYQSAICSSDLHTIGAVR